MTLSFQLSISSSNTVRRLHLSQVLVLVQNEFITGTVLVRMYQVRAISVLQAYHCTIVQE